MKRMMLAFTMILMFMMSACSSKNVAKDEDKVLIDNNLQSNDEKLVDGNLLLELEEYRNTISYNRNSKKMSKLIDKYLKLALRRAYSKDVANKYVQDSCEYYFSKGFLTVGGEAWWELKYHTPEESNIKIIVTFDSYLNPYTIGAKIKTLSGYESFRFSRDSGIVSNIERYMNYDKFIVGSSNELIDTKYDELKILDKVKYGSIGNVDMIWTVCKKSEGKVLLCSDYAFNIDNIYYDNYDHYEEVSILNSDLALLNNMFNDNELSHLIKIDYKDWKYGYYYFTLPTSIYDEVLDEESKNVIGTIDLN